MIIEKDVTEIEQDSECGIYIEEFDDWQENDVISAFELIFYSRLIAVVFVLSIYFLCQHQFVPKFYFSYWRRNLLSKFIPF